MVHIWLEMSNISKGNSHQVNYNYVEKKKKIYCSFKHKC